jgi:hypothetical protein
LLWLLEELQDARDNNMERRDEFSSNSLIGHTPFKQLSPFLKANEEATKTYPASRGEDKVLQNLNVHMLQTIIFVGEDGETFQCKITMSHCLSLPYKKPTKPQGRTRKV